MLYRLSLLVALAPLILLSGCSSVVQKPQEQAYSAEVARLLAGKPLIGHDVGLADFPEVDIFAISPEMANFAEQVTEPEAGGFDKVRALHHALLKTQAEGGRGIEYNAFTTEAPVNVFAERKANCLSFTLLYVALARHLDLKAYVNEVQIPPTWNMRDNGTIYFMRHVNVRVKLQPDMSRGLLTKPTDDAIIDLEMDRYKPSYPQEPISDQLTAVQFYSNRAMEFEAHGDIVSAFLYVRKALLENDQQSYVWNNLASLYRHENMLHEAEILYLHGLALNRDDLTIINNLATLYQRMGNTAQAEQYSKRARHYRQSNPFYQYMLALSANDVGDNVSALSYINNAIRREKKDARFYQLAATIYGQLGNAKKAEEKARLAVKYQRTSE